MFAPLKLDDRAGIPYFEILRPFAGMRKVDFLVLPFDVRYLIRAFFESHFETIMEHDSCCYKRDDYGDKNS